MKEALAELLKPVAGHLAGFFSVIPLWGVQVILVLMMAGLGGWIASLRHEGGQKSPRSSEERPGRALFHDRRFWAVMLLGMQCVLILVFR